ncbi:MAG: ABC transporter [Phycisphaeraceae bacterium]|nr:ABC transporter [Phycisphaeraceae bacterium]
MIQVVNPDPQRLAAFLAQLEAGPDHAEAVRVMNIVKHYTMGQSVVRALDGVDLTIARGEYVSIMGSSGSGKTTLFNMMGGLDKPTDGKVFVDDVDIAELDPTELAWLRCRKIGYIFQTFNLIGTITALENVLLPMSFAGLTHDEALDRGVEILTRVGLGERCKHKPTQLSGGQQQRVAIARAFANRPAMILADEPTGNLDQRTGQQIISMLKELNQESGVTIVSATHDHKMLDVSDRIVWMSDGRIERIERRGDLDIEVGRIGDE